MSNIPWDVTFQKILVFAVCVNLTLEIENASHNVI
jgi:hypothetical protein